MRYTKPYQASYHPVMDPYIHFVKQENESRDRMVLCQAENLKIRKSFGPSQPVLVAAIYLEEC